MFKPLILPCPSTQCHSTGTTIWLSLVCNYTTTIQRSWWKTMWNGSILMELWSGVAGQRILSNSFGGLTRWPKIRGQEEWVPKYPPFLGWAKSGMPWQLHNWNYQQSWWEIISFKSSRLWIFSLCFRLWASQELSKAEEKECLKMCCLQLVHCMILSSVKRLKRKPMTSW